MQASKASFADTPKGHKFVLRMPLAKATANRCAECGEDIRLHSREEVTDDQLLSVLNTQDDGKPTSILAGELSVGGYKSVLQVAKSSTASTAVLNCAGHKLHDFLPITRKDFDRLRNANPSRLYDLEWDDSEEFCIEWADIEAALAWARVQVASGLEVVVNCAQGKSRSGTMATAYVMSKLQLPVAEALAVVRERRPLVMPNPSFLRQLHEFEALILQQPQPRSREEVRLREAFDLYDVDQSGGLSVHELRLALMRSGEPANAAKAMVDEYASTSSSSAELGVDDFVRAWLDRGCGPIALPVAMPVAAVAGHEDKPGAPPGLW